jgi:cytochrome c biogenesis protein
MDRMSSAAAPLTLRRSLALVWRSLRSMRTALILLLLLAVAAIAGSLVPQFSNSPMRVASIFRDHPLRARIYDSLGLFDVYGSWWFTLIYTLLLVSLGACLVPRTRAMIRNLRARPQPARELDALRHYAEVPVAAAAEDAARLSRRVLRRSLFRVSRGGTGHSVAADKGLAREGGSLLFHWSFFLILVGVVFGKGTGFTGYAVISEGECWVEAAANYDGNIRTGRFFGGDHTGARVCVQDFEDRFRRSGQPMDFVTTATVRSGDGGPARPVEIRVNEPAGVDGVRYYQYAFGWSPVIQVRRAGRLIASGPVQFERDPVPPGLGELQVPWHGALRLPTTEPQVGIEFQLWPDSRAFFAVAQTGTVPLMNRVFRPVLRYRAFEGDLASELRPTFATLDTGALREFGSGVIGAGQTVDLGTGRAIASASEDRGSGVAKGAAEGAAEGASAEGVSKGRGAGEDLTVTFADLKRYTVLQVARDRGLWIMLAAAILILLGLVPALYTSRRKVWVRAEPASEGSVLKIGGYALQRTSQFEEEFARLVDRLARAAGRSPGEDARSGSEGERASAKPERPERGEVVGSR